MRDGASVAEDGPRAISMLAGEENAQAGSAGDFSLFSDAVALLPREYRGLVVGYLSRAWHEAADLAALVERLTEELAALRLPTRADRLAERDDAIRNALATHYGAMSRRAAAETLARDLARYVSGGWLRERELSELPAGASELRRALHQLAKLNDGASIRWRRIFDIASRAITDR